MTLKERGFEFVLGTIKNIATRAVAGAVEAVVDEVQEGLEHVDERVKVIKKRAQDAGRRGARKRPYVVDAEVVNIRERR